MNIFAKTGPRGDPIPTPSVCLYILRLNVNSTSVVAHLISFRNRSSGIVGLVIVSLWKRVLIAMSIVSSSSTFVYRLVTSKEHR